MCFENGIFSNLLKQEPSLIKNYKKIKEPGLNFTFNRLIWFPKNWKITPAVNPTEVINYIAIFIIASTLFINNLNKIKKNLRFTLNKYSEYKNSSHYPFWRWTNFFLRTWVYFCNVFFYLGVSNKIKYFLSKRFAYIFFLLKACFSICEWN